MRSIRVSLTALVAVAAAWVIGPALAQPAPAELTFSLPAEKRIALVIGNAAYRHAPRLDNPKQDAEAVAAALQKTGFELIGGGAQMDLDVAGLRRAVNEFVRRRVQGSVTLFYYAGHGYEIAGRNYLVPVDADPQDPTEVDFQLFDLDILLRNLSAADNRLNMILLDACRNNPFGGRGLRGGAGLAAPEKQPSGTIISYATAPGSVAKDGPVGGNSPYTAALVAAIQKPGVGVLDTFNDVAATVKRRTGGQEPWTNFKAIEGQFFFVPAGSTVTIQTPAAPAATAGAGMDADMMFWQSIATSTDPADYRAYLESFPQGRFAPLARNRAAAPQQQATAARAKPEIAPMPPPARGQPVVGMVPSPGDDRRAGEVFRDCPACPEMVVLPAGEFVMGSPAIEPNRGADEGPQVRITLSRPPAVGRYEVTFSEWDACVSDGGCNGHRPGDGEWGRGNRPVIDVSWSDAQSYVGWLSRKTGQHYRLLTESEWEYAARAGSSSAYAWGDKVGRGNAVCSGCGTEWDLKGTAPVGSFPANGFGLHDMLGNVYEWVEDAYRDGLSGQPPDGDEWSGSGDMRVLRGGSWNYDPRFLRSASRGRGYIDTRSQNIGFRVARTPAR